jgi:hypothetical protein
MRPVAERNESAFRSASMCERVVDICLAEAMRLATPEAA